MRARKFIRIYADELCPNAVYSRFYTDELLKKAMDAHTKMMQYAIDIAKQGAAAGEVPVGAVVYCIKNGEAEILAAAHNETIANHNPTHHAEFLACTRAAKKLSQSYLEDCHVAITLEPCAMCAQALSYFRVQSIRFGAYDVKSGGTENGARVLDHAHYKPGTYGGILEAECGKLLTDFFKDKRDVE